MLKCVYVDLKFVNNAKIKKLIKLYEDRDPFVLLLINISPQNRFRDKTTVLYTCTVSSIENYNEITVYPESTL